MIRQIGYALSVLSGDDAVTPAQTSDAAAAAPLTNPKNGPKSLMAANPVTYSPGTLVWNDSFSSGKPSATSIFMDRRYGSRAPPQGRSSAVRGPHGLLVDPDDLRSRPTVNVVPGQPRREPPLEGKPTDLPELPLDGVAVFWGEPG